MYKFNIILPREIIFTVYNAFYKSIIQYGVIVWGDCAKNSIRQLEIQQKSNSKNLLKKII